MNHEYTNPIPFSKNRKTGRLLYTLAEHGYAPSDDERHHSGYTTIKKDKRFKLWVKTGITFHKLLELDGEGDIIPAKGITFSQYEP